MEIEILKYNELIYKELENFINLLYTNEIKPSLINIENSHSIIIIRSSKELKGFLAVYLSDYIDNVIFLGHYQCVENYQYSNELLNKAIEHSKFLNKKIIIGPVNGSTWHNYRFSTDHRPHFFLENIHKLFYPDQWRSAGFEEYEYFQSNIEYISNLHDLPEENEYFDQNNFQIRGFNTENPISELTLIYDFSSKFFKNNLLYTPISKSDFLEIYKPVIKLIDTNLVEMVFDDDKMVGLYFCMNDFYNPKQVIVKTIARDSSYKYKGLIHNMSIRFCKKFIKLEYETMVHAYFHLENKSKRVSNNFGGKPYQNHILYKMKL